MNQQIVRVIAPTDFSPAADRAAQRAASVASTLGSILHLAHVLPPREVLAQLNLGSAANEAEVLRSRAERALQERAQHLTDRYGITALCELYYGRAHQAILDASASLGADLIVLGAQGEREGASPSQTVGDTALKLAEQSGVATLLVRREAQVPYCHVVACAKAVPADRAVFEWANRVSPADLIHILSAYEVPYEWRLREWGVSSATMERYATRERESRTRRLSDLMSEFGLPAARARLHVERGEPLPIILRSADHWQADLLVVGRRAQASPLSAERFGSVARHIAFLAPMDVMIVPPLRVS
jgi:nucleotide-binding universal stress UspA family protein